jgi:hypothetical protein
MRAAFLRRETTPAVASSGHGDLPLGAPASTEAAAAPTADLVLLAALLAVTALFGKSFAKVNLGGELFITEPVLAMVIVLALLRVGLRGAVRRVREAVPLVPLVLLWLAGAVATLRGLADFGLADVTHDVGLVEYSVMLALVPIVADSRERLRLLLTILLAASVGAMLLWATGFALPPDVAPGLWPNPASAAAIYFSIFLVWAAARAAHGLRLHPAEWALILLGTTLLSLMTVRSAWVAMAAAVVVLAMLAPQGRRLRTLGAGIAVFVFSNVSAYGVDRAREGWANTPVAVSSASASPNYIADDGISGLAGGRVVRGDAVQGSLSREIRSGQLLGLTSLAGLEPGRKYALRFWVKPLRAQPASGRIGDTAGTGWSTQQWSTYPKRKWQACKETLTPTATSERLVIINDGGPPTLVDGLRVMKGFGSGESGGASCGEAPGGPSPRPAPAGPGQAPGTPSPPPAPAGPGQAPGGASPTPPPAGGPGKATPGIVSEAKGTFTPGVGDTNANPNARWRLAISWFMLKETAKTPLLGVGFGRPTNFEWEGVYYDRRRGDPNDPNDVTGPHDSFVNLLYRTGLLGVIPFLVLVTIAIRRLRSGLIGAPASHRARVVAAGAALAFAAAIAALNVALEGPQMGLFLWGELALLFLIPRWHSAAPDDIGRREANYRRSLRASRRREANEPD